jgi:hypothetical protein
VDAHFDRDGERAGNYVAIMCALLQKSMAQFGCELSWFVQLLKISDPDLSSVGKYYRIKEVP